MTDDWESIRNYIDDYEELAKAEEDLKRKYQTYLQARIRVDRLRRERDHNFWQLFNRDVKESEKR